MIFTEQSAGELPCLNHCMMLVRLEQLAQHAKLVCAPAHGYSSSVNVFLMIVWRVIAISTSAISASYPVLLQASTSKSPYLGMSNKGASPAPSIAHLFPHSPYPDPPSLPAEASAVKQKHAMPEQRDSPEPAVLREAAAESASDNQKTRAQTEADTLSAAQAASRLSLLQAEQTQVELELANATQTADGSQIPSPCEPDSIQRTCEQALVEAVLFADTGRHIHQAWPQDAAAVGTTEAGSADPHGMMAEQDNSLGLSHQSTSQISEPAAPGTQSKPAKSAQQSLSQPERPRTHRQTRSSARASLAAQKATSEAVSSASTRRGKAQAKTFHALPVVTEQAEAVSAVSTAKSLSEEPITGEAAAAQMEPGAAADPTIDSAVTAQQLEATLPTVPEEEEAQHLGAIGAEKHGEDPTGMTDDCAAHHRQPASEAADVCNMQVEASPAAAAAASTLTADLNSISVPGQGLVRLAAPGLLEPPCAVNSRPLSMDAHTDISKQHTGTEASNWAEASPGAVGQAALPESAGAMHEDAVGTSEGPTAADVSNGSMPLAAAAGEGAAAAAAPGHHLHMHSQGTQQSPDAAVGQDAESQPLQKLGARARRPPKPKQPVKRKQTRKRGRQVAQQDENADINAVPTGSSPSCMQPEAQQSCKPAPASPLQAVPAAKDGSAAAAAAAAADKQDEHADKPQR